MYLREDIHIAQVLGWTFLSKTRIINVCFLIIRFLISSHEGRNRYAQDFEIIMMANDIILGTNRRTLVFIQKLGGYERPLILKPRVIGRNSYSLELYVFYIKDKAFAFP